MWYCPSAPDPNTCYSNSDHILFNHLPSILQIEEFPRTNLIIQWVLLNLHSCFSLILDFYVSKAITPIYLWFLSISNSKPYVLVDSPKLFIVLWIPYLYAHCFLFPAIVSHYNCEDSVQLPLKTPSKKRHGNRLRKSFINKSAGWKIMDSCSQNSYAVLIIKRNSFTEK